MAEIQSNNAQDAPEVNNGNNVSEKEKQAVYGQRKWPLCPSPSPGPAALPCSPSLVQHYQICRKSGLVRRRLLSVEHSQEPARCWSRSPPAGPRVRVGLESGEEAVEQSREGGACAPVNVRACCSGVRCLIFLSWFGLIGSDCLKSAMVSAVLREAVHISYV